jgi:hypothetical protein
MPIGAMGVALCFSAASINTTKTSCIVRNISIKRPWTIDVSLLRVVVAKIGPGERPETTPAAAIAPRI